MAIWALAGGAIASGLGAYFGSKKKGEGFETQVFEDPYKTRVSSPLSSYLATQIGKGLPRYTEATGRPLYEPIDTSAYSKFLSIDPGEWYTKAIQEPTLKAAREEVPFIEEGWAGSLRGSGRFRDVEDYWSDVAETLSQGRYQAEMEIPQAQYKMAESYAEARTRQRLLEYEDWYKSLPEMNPSLAQAFEFLKSDSGWNLAAVYKQGQAPWYAGWLSSIGSMLGSYGLSRIGGGAGGGTAPFGGETA